MVSRAALTEALSQVRDPELDEPITDLGFVSELRLEAGEVHVRLRLPTYFCAPNFAYLMVADARAALAGVAGVEHAQVTLDDHFASPEINGGVAASRDFEGTFPDHADGELEELRLLFDRKAFVVRQERLCQALMRGGHTVEQLVAMRLGEVPPSAERDAYLERRARLGLDCGAGASLLVRPNGEAIPVADAARQLRFARTVRVSIEGNADLCRGLLQTRYGLARENQREAGGALR